MNLAICKYFNDSIKRFLSSNILFTIPLYFIANVLQESRDDNYLLYYF